MSGFLRLIGGSGSDPDDGMPPVDPDISFAVAYVSRELTLVEIAAFEDRLATDPAFRERVQFVLDLANLRTTFADTHGVTPQSAQVPAAKARDIEAGWQRYLRETAPAGSSAGPARLAHDRPAPRARGRIDSRLGRIAAIIALTVLPVIGIAQVIAHFRQRDTNSAIIGGINDRPASVTLDGPGIPANRGANDTTSNGPNAMKRALLFLAGLPGVIPAQSGQPGGPPAHLLGPVVARSSVTLGSAAQLVSLSDGRVLVADPKQRLVLLFDAALSNPKVVLDSAMGRANTFNSGIGAPVAGGGGGAGAGRTSGAGGGPPTLRGLRANYLLPFRGDSSLWLDPVAEVFIVIDPAGRIARTMPQPPLLSMTDNRPAPPASSSVHGLIYRMTRRGTPGGLLTNGNAPPAKPLYPTPTVDTLIVYADSQMLVRVNVDTRVADTIGLLPGGHVQPIEYLWRTSRVGTRDMTEGGFAFVPLLESLRFVDDFATTSDGSIAILRSREYRLDWIGADGARTQQKLTYPWRRLTDDTRKYLLDSARVLSGMDADAAVAKWIADSARFGRLPVNAGNRPMVPRTQAQRDSQEASMRAAMSAMTGQPAPNGPAIAPEIRVGPWVLGAQTPDYFPPVPPVGALKADGDNNVWIKQVLATPDPGYEVWEVVNRTRGVIDRVRIPTDRTIVGFGKGGFVYLAAYNAGVARLEKVRVK